MTVTRTRRRPPRRKKRRGIVLLVALALAFVLGIGFGESLHDNPDAGGTQTIVRTLHVLPLAPAALKTVTVTTSGP